MREMIKKLKKDNEHYAKKYHVFSVLTVIMRAIFVSALILAITAFVCGVATADSELLVYPLSFLGASVVFGVISALAYKLEMCCDNVIANTSCLLFANCRMINEYKDNATRDFALVYEQALRSQYLRGENTV